MALFAILQKLLDVTDYEDAVARSENQKNVILISQPHHRRAYVIPALVAASPFYMAVLLPTT